MYSPAIVETHHIHKLDAPSGTAITLANGIIEVNHHYTKYTDAKSGTGEIPIQSIRDGNVPGTHTITWNSDTDKITLMHETKNRSGLAFGAVMAASWVKDRHGVFTMKDMLNL